MRIIDNDNLSVRLIVINLAVCLGLSWLIKAARGNDEL